MGEQMDGCSGLAPLWHLIAVQMTGFKKKGGIYKVLKWMPRVVLIFAEDGRFRSRGLISQQRADFAAEGLFRSKWTFSQPISQLRNTLRNGVLAAKMEFLRL